MMEIDLTGTPEVLWRFRAGAPDWVEIGSPTFEVDGAAVTARCRVAGSWPPDLGNGATERHGRGADGRPRPVPDPHVRSAPDNPVVRFRYTLTSRTRGG